MFSFKQFCNEGKDEIFNITEVHDVDADLGLKDIHMFLHSLIDADGSL